MRLDKGWREIGLRDTAYAKADELLLEHLDAEQRQEYLHGAQFRVRTGRAEYLVRHQEPSTIFWVEPCDDAKWLGFGVLYGISTWGYRYGNPPVPDQLLAAKLILSSEEGEKRVLNEACR